MGSNDRHSGILVLAAGQYRDVLIVVNDQDRRRKRALIVFQIVIYAALITMFLIQLQMLTVKDW